jgi:ArsR family transcriptional regulator
LTTPQIILLYNYKLIDVVMTRSIEETANIFKALGDPTRLKILKLIAATGNDLCVGMIARQLGISQPAVSQHLKVLRNAGLVESSRQGFHVHYRLESSKLEGYGIDAGSLMNSFGSELNLEVQCELEGNAERCNSLQK